jgi:hypothetical protein
MRCSLCEKARARRACPALGRDICTVCCGTKRVVEISCPPGCVYLASSRSHPPAVVRRQHDRDLGFLAPVVAGLSEDQIRLFFSMIVFIDAHKPGDLAALRDADVVEAAAAMASTLETAARGLIYEHRPQSYPAARLAAELKGFVGSAARESRLRDEQVAAALRRIERAARDASGALDGGEGAFMQLSARTARNMAGVLPDAGAGPREGAAASPIIIT